MRVLILNPGSIFSKNVVRDVIYGCWCKGKRIGGGTVLPYWLILVATILKKEAEVEVDYIDARSNPRFSPEDYQVVIINTSSMSFNEDVHLLGIFKKRNPQILTVIFGSHPTFMPKYCLEKEEIDIIVRGEPDYILRDLIKSFKEGRSWEEINGIGYNKGGEKIINPPYPYIDNLDELPFLDDSFIPDLVYFNPLIKRYPYISLITSRGCPGRCVFCPAASFYGDRYRFQSAERVVAEMEYFYRKGYREVYFRDETFTFVKRRVYEICRLLIKRRIKMFWICNARIGTVDLDLLKLMKIAGCHWIKFGVESGSQEILDMAKKGIKIDDIERTFQWARKVGINTHAHFMLGMPGETRDTLKQTIEFAKKIKPTTASFGICTPYPGTPLFEEVAKNHPEIRDGSDVDFSSLHLQGFFNEEFTSLKKEVLNKAVFRAYREFYLRPLYILSWFGKIKDFQDLRRITLAGANILDFVLRGD